MHALYGNELSLVWPKIPSTRTINDAHDIAAVGTTFNYDAVLAEHQAPGLPRPSFDHIIFP